MEQVLKLDEDCEEAENDLFYCKVQQLMVNQDKVIMNFSTNSLEKEHFLIHLICQLLTSMFDFSIRNLVLRRHKVFDCWKASRRCRLFWHLALMLRKVTGVVNVSWNNPTCFLCYYGSEALISNPFSNIAGLLLLLCSRESRPICCATRVSVCSIEAGFGASFFKTSSFKSHNLIFLLEARALRSG